jgi:hypothetical protein
MFSSFLTDTKVSKFIDKEQMSKNPDATSESSALKAEFGAELSALMNQTVETKETMDPTLEAKVNLILARQYGYTDVFSVSEENGIITIKQGKREVVIIRNPNNLNKLRVKLFSDRKLLKEVYEIVSKGGKKGKTQKSPYAKRKMYC